jgi:ferredoxin
VATTITEACVNCGACEPECPNDAIYEGGAPWELAGTMHPPLSADYFFIAAEKCTECVGFFEQEQCALVCPVECCVPDPDNRESEAALLSRARQLHPDVAFGEPIPSRFR